jgi:CheY-like chemotaxis protein
MGKLARDTFPQNITVSGHVAADLWPVRGNATQLHQVLLNLCINARDAMPGGGSLSLAADNMELNEEEARAIPNARPGAFAVLIVSDTGAGIPAEVLPKIFDPFFTTKPEGQGTGLGLSTIARIVKAHDGFITLQSQPGAGTIFEVYLPRFAEAAARSEGKDAAAPPRGQGELILVADDEEAVRELLRRSLEDYGYRVMAVANGAEAVSLFKQKPGEVALLLSDQSMPVMDGREAVAAIRAMRADLPVVFLSGDGEGGATDAGGSREKVGYLSKPIELDGLLREVNRRLCQVIRD